MAKNKKLIGTVFVDAGIVMVADPCYTLPDDGTNRTDVATDWPTFIDRLYTGDKMNHEPLGRGIGIVVPSGSGDGEYPVYVVENDQGGVVQLIVDFA
jgi:hypothetical protein